jgi:tRNA A-37 threonylcarbamoyl transferase component Bud32
MQEVRSTLKARKLGVRTPVVYYVEHEASTIYMEKVLGTSLKDLLLQSQLSAEGTATRMHPFSEGHVGLALPGDCQDVLVLM